MRRGVEGGAVAGGGEDAGEGGGGAAFAVGSGDEDGREGGLGVAEGRGEDAHVGEVELAAWRGGRRGGVKCRSQLMPQGVEMVDGCVVGHGGILGDGGAWAIKGCNGRQKTEGKRLDV